MVAINLSRLEILWTRGRAWQYSFDTAQIKSKSRGFTWFHYMITILTARHSHTELDPKPTKHKGEKCHLSFKSHDWETANKLESRVSSTLIPHAAKRQVLWFWSSKHKRETAFLCLWCWVQWRAPRITHCRMMAVVTIMIKQYIARERKKQMNNKVKPRCSLL